MAQRAVYDVAIIGSGAGGGMAAYVLTKAGANVVMEPADQFYGERTYRAIDPEGHVWNFAQPVAELTIAQMEEAKAKLEEAAKNAKPYG